MKIFIKNLLTIFFLTVGFFLFSGSSSVEACQIVSAATRPNGIINNYSDVTGGRPFVYLDVRTQNCNTSPSQILEVNFFAEPITAFPIDHIQTIKVEIGSGGTLSSQSNFRTSLSDFSIPIYLGEKGNGSDSGYNYCRLNGTINSTCKIFVQILNLNNGANSNPIYSLGQLGGPFPLTYTCQNFCDVSWQLGCPVGAGIAPDPLPYGVPNICSTDTATQNVTGEVPSSGSGPSATEYSTEPLAPLPGFTGDPNLGQWLESLFTILIVIAGILALIMIIVGGITYITSESFGGKGQGKAYIINAIIGLVLALGAWVILNTINPNLAEDLNLNIPNQLLTVDQGSFSEFEDELVNGQSFVLAGTFDTPQTSPGLSQFLDNINQGNQITSIAVNTSSNSMVIASNDGANVTIPVTGLGLNGVSEEGQGVEGDKKTPKGSWQITSDIRISQNQNDAQTPAIGNFNMGPAFIGTNISTPSGTIRGIGIHGNKNNTPGATMGCVRIKNDDVLALARKIVPGVTLTIN